MKPESPNQRFLGRKARQKSEEGEKRRKIVNTTKRNEKKVGRGEERGKH